MKKNAATNFFSLEFAIEFFIIPLTWRNLKVSNRYPVYRVTVQSRPERHMFMPEIADDNRDEGQKRLSDIKVHF